MEQLRQALKRAGIDAIIAYVDDWFLTAATETEMLKAMAIFREILSSMGWAINEKKTAGPTQRIEALGIVFDTAERCLSLSLEKRNKICTELNAVQSEVASATTTGPSVASMRRLAGRLQYCAIAVPGGTTALREIYTASAPFSTMSSRKAALTRMTLPPSVISDLEWWSSALAQAPATRRLWEVTGRRLCCFEWRFEIDIVLVFFPTWVLASLLSSYPKRASVSLFI
eukprot:GDKH01018147.1.p2 GENE.GDKH01018147.1~~GDKH01018147.1.p2  ORF type:complete len:228 (+),score=21.08 GDKH01018147.1:1148-1831(+)